MKMFKADAVAAQEMEDLNSFTLIVAENEDGSGSRLEIQKALAFDEQDRELGQDTYCVVTDTGATHYGGIESWVLEGGVLEIKLPTEVAGLLGLDGGLRIEIDPAHHRLVQASMTRLVG